MENKHSNFLALTIVMVFALLIIIFGILFNIRLIAEVSFSNFGSNIKGIMIVYVMIPALIFWMDGIILLILYYYKQNKGIFKKW